MRFPQISRYTQSTSNIVKNLLKQEANFFNLEWKGSAQRGLYVVKYVVFRWKKSE